MLMFVVYCLFFCQSIALVFGKEFCNSETFKTYCKQNELVFIESAIYGRENYGKCLSVEGESEAFLKKRKGFIGCFSDVKHIIEPRCAGRQSCELSVAKIQVETNCSKYLLKYLDVDYLCVKGKSHVSCLHVSYNTSNLIHRNILIDNMSYINPYSSKVEP